MGYSRKKSKHEGGGLVEDMEFPARGNIINEIACGIRTPT